VYQSLCTNTHTCIDDLHTRAFIITRARTHVNSLHTQICINDIYTHKCINVYVSDSPYSICLFDSLYTLSDSLYTLSDSLYTLSHSLYTLSHSLYTLSDSLYTLSDSLYTISCLYVVYRPLCHAPRVGREGEKAWRRRKRARLLVSEDV